MCNGDSGTERGNYGLIAGVPALSTVPRGGGGGVTSIINPAITDLPPMITGSPRREEEEEKSGRRSRRRSVNSMLKGRGGVRVAMHPVDVSAGGGFGYDRRGRWTRTSARRGKKGGGGRHRFPAWRRISNDDGVVVGTVVK